MSVFTTSCEAVAPEYLRVFPQTPVTFSPTRPAVIPVGFERFNKAFQLATGWKLSWSQDCGALVEENHDRQEPTCLASGRIQIEDLSTLFPPGQPAASRIYCNHLILRLNQLLDELIPGTAGPETEHRVLTVPGCGDTLPVHLTPCFLDQISIVPLEIPEPVVRGDIRKLAGCQWLVQSSGELVAVAFSVAGSTELLVPAMISAQSTFIATARLVSGCELIHEQLQAAIRQLFCGDIEISGTVWALDPLTGRAEIFGDGEFEILLERETIPVKSGHLHSFSWYRNQIMMISNPAGTGETDCELDNTWRNTAFDCLRHHSAADWRSSLSRLIDRQIPSIVETPSLALAMIRH